MLYVVLGYITPDTYNQDQKCPYGYIYDNQTISCKGMLLL